MKIEAQKKEKRPSVTYKPLKEPVIIKEERPPATYRQPIQPIKNAKPAYKVETTTTEKPTESSVYYKAYENGVVLKMIWERHTKRRISSLYIKLPYISNSGKKFYTVINTYQKMQFHAIGQN